MWGWVKKAAKAVVHVVRGVGSSVVQVIKGVVHRVIGIPEFVGTLLGWMPEKQIAVEALILMKGGIALASLSDVQDVLDRADKVFRDEARVHIVNRQGGKPLILAAEVPSGNLSVTCRAIKVFASNFSSVGSWFRDHQVRKVSGTVLGYGHPVTVFIVQNVEGDNSGCCPGFFADYAVIDPGALSGGTGKKLTLAHEVAHACGLWHYSSPTNLMKHASAKRTGHMSRLQKAVFRSSGHVTRAKSGTIVE
jgi:hypothetical protein